MSMPFFRWRAATLLFTLAACSSVPSPEPWPIDSNAQMRPDAMVIEPAVAQPGEIVAVTFPNGWERGILYAIDVARADGWERRYLLISDANGGRPTWFAAGDDENAVVEAIGIGGAGPDRVRIPEPLESGAYRICTANAVEAVCTPIEIAAP